MDTPALQFDNLVPKGIELVQQSSQTANVFTLSQCMSLSVVTIPDSEEAGFPTSRDLKPAPVLWCSA